MNSSKTKLASTYGVSQKSELNKNLRKIMRQSKQSMSINLHGEIGSIKEGFSSGEEDVPKTMKKAKAPRIMSAQVNSYRRKKSANRTRNQNNELNFRTSH